METSRDNARRLCMTTLNGTPPWERSLLMDFTRECTRLVLAAGDQAIAIWSLGIDTRPADAIAGARLGCLRGSLRRGVVVSAREERRSHRAWMDALVAILAIPELIEAGVTTDPREAR